jgi:hypothetical protein
MIRAWAVRSEKSTQAGAQPRHDNSITTPTPSPRAISTPSTDLTMSLAASRAVLRQSTFAVRRAGLRNASTTSEAAGAVKDKAGQAASKASEGLSKVQSSASSAASKASETASATTQKASGLAGTVQGQWSRVFGHRAGRDWHPRGCEGDERGGRRDAGAQWHVWRALCSCPA